MWTSVKGLVSVLLVVTVAVALLDWESIGISPPIKSVGGAETFKANITDLELKLGEEAKALEAARLELEHKTTLLQQKAKLIEKLQNEKKDAQSRFAENSAGEAAVASSLANSQWCPSAKCHDTALCRPCLRRFLIVVTEGRAASTTLTWMLDSLPGITMSGENNDALGKIKTMQDSTIGFKSMMRANNADKNADKTAWSHHKFVDQSFSCISQEMIRFLNPPNLNQEGEYVDSELAANEIVGFKTIRMFQNFGTDEEEQAFVQWLEENFPCARYIINYNSDIEASVRSRAEHFGKDSSGAREDMKRQQSQLLRLAELLGSQAYTLDKSEWTGGNMTYINDAVQWLGFHDSCKFTEILEYNTQDGYKATKTEVQPWADTCKPL